MCTDSIRDRVIEIIAEQAVLDVSDIDTTQSLDDLGIDSLGLVEAIFSIEETFDIQVPFNANAPRRFHHQKRPQALAAAAGIGHCLSDGAVG